MTGIQDRCSRRGQAISLSLALMEEIDKKEGGKSLCVGGKTMDFDFCQVLYSTIDDIYNFRLRLRNILSSTQEIIRKQHNRSSRQASAEIRSGLVVVGRKLLFTWRSPGRGLAGRDPGWKFWGWGRLRKRANRCGGPGQRWQQMSPGRLIIADEVELWQQKRRSRRSR